jgi:hypothetical protein
MAIRPGKSSRGTTAAWRSERNGTTGVRIAGKMEHPCRSTLGSAFRRVARRYGRARQNELAALGDVGAVIARRAGLPGDRRQLLLLAFAVADGNAAEQIPLRQRTQAPKASRPGRRGHR